MDSEVQMAIPILQRALNNTTSQLLTKLIELIEKDVYSYGASWTNGWDGGVGRTGEFGKSWEKTKAIIEGNIVSSEIYQNASAMVYGYPFSHGSSKSGALGEDDLANIIEAGFANTGIGFPEMAARPFWKEFTTYVDEHFEDILIMNCKILGLDVDNITASVSY